MSNSIRYDPLLVRALSGELREALQGRQAHPQPVFDAELACTLPLDRGQALRMDLHPRRGWIRVVPDDGSGSVREDLDLSARIARVSAPADERMLRIDLHEGGRFRGGRRSLVVELHTCRAAPEVHELFRVVNSTRPIQRFLRDETETLALEVREHVRDTYPAFVCASARHNVPNVNVDAFAQADSTKGEGRRKRDARAGCETMGVGDW